MFDTESWKMLGLKTNNEQILLSVKKSCEAT